MPDIVMILFHLGSAPLWLPSISWQYAFIACAYNTYAILYNPPCPPSNSYGYAPPLPNGNSCTAGS